MGYRSDRLTLTDPLALLARTETWMADCENTVPGHARWCGRRTTWSLRSGSAALRAVGRHVQPHPADGRDPREAENGNSRAFHDDEGRILYFNMSMLKHKIRPPIPCRRP